MSKAKGDLSDLYFIFADNVYEKYITTDSFRALINFYALLYNRIIIPDTFFINNSHLLNFLHSGEGLKYIEKGIIVPSARIGTISLVHTYESFEENGTLQKSSLSKLEVLNTLEQIDLSKSITWSIDEISGHFTKNIAENLTSLEINIEDKKYWEDKIYALSDNNLSRKRLYDLLKEIQFNEENTKKLLSQYIDITYNFNIPNFYKTSAAYPDMLVRSSRQTLTPEQVFFQTSASISQFDHITSDYFIHTNLFNEGILKSLNAEQIDHMRKQKEYIKLQRAFRKGENHIASVEDSLTNFIYMFDSELSRIISHDIKEKLNKEKRKLFLQTLGTEAVAGDGVGVGMGTLSQTIGLVLDGVQEFIGGKVIGSAVKIALSPFSRKTETGIKHLELQGKKIVKDMENDTNILDVMKSFSLNSLRQ
ncbi:hypothetical protein [Niallia sp. FSL M8-0099]|uniref:hypothetical protein n=2 Tax=unclassified Niallia TaxID=2837522 RepID=UPI0030FC6DC6